VVSRRSLLTGLIVPAVWPAPLWAQLSSADAWQALKAPGAIALFRHAIAPGGGDPSGFVLGDCRTQRNLSTEGQQQARRLGESVKAQGVAVSEVWHSEWCRTTESARLAFPEMNSKGLRPESAFNSFFGKPEEETFHTSRALKLLLGWRGPGALVVFTHQVNITALTGIVPQSGEGVVLRPEGGRLLVQGRILP
jgi:phosphohistidine phosphatase SixA